uniref:Uncharacterized protein n=1 Tax=Arundo donax TaxID=35708 RepID=A0A0A9H725_ARUDO
MPFLGTPCSVGTSRLGVPVKHWSCSRVCWRMASCLRLSVSSMSFRQRRVTTPDCRSCSTACL